MKLRHLAWILLACAACRTERIEEPRGMALHKIEKLAPKRAWNVLEGEQVVGSIVLFADPDAPDDIATQFFSVRNPWQQELGSLDGLGRAWRFSPHRREAELVGSGTVLEGARRILGASANAKLEPVELRALRAVPASKQK